MESHLHLVLRPSHHRQETEPKPFSHFPITTPTLHILLSGNSDMTCVTELYHITYDLSRIDYLLTAESSLTSTCAINFDSRSLVYKRPHPENEGGTGSSCSLPLGLSLLAGFLSRSILHSVVLCLLLYC